MPPDSVEPRLKRKLTTILAADAANFSSAMLQDEDGTLIALRRARAIIDTHLARYEGRIANTAGDGIIAEFPSVVDAVLAAVDIQRDLAEARKQDADALLFRVGLHLGDVMVDGSDLLGEGVNLASRLESMAEPGGILLSQQVYDQVGRKMQVEFEYLRDERPKNYDVDVPVYRVTGTTPGARLATVMPKLAPDRPGAVTPLQSFLEWYRASPEAMRRILGLAGGIVLLNLVVGGGFWSFWVLLALAGTAFVKLLRRGR